jgi:hypothetical protein
MLNRMTGSPAEPYEGSHGAWKAKPGNFHISGAYGGYALHRMVNEGGGVSDIFSRGHMPARELYELIHAFRRGLEFLQVQS